MSELFTKGSIFQLQMEVKEIMQLVNRQRMNEKCANIESK